MQKNEVIFIINDQARINLFLPRTLDNIVCYDDVMIRYIHDDIPEYTIYEDEGIVQFLYELRGCLSQVLTGVGTLDKSFQEGLGYLWNVYINHLNRTRVCKKDLVG